MDLQFDLATTPFTLAQARQGGLARTTLNRLVAEGSVRRVLRNVYVAAAVEDTLELRARALALVVPPHVVICDRTAAWLHGVDVLGFTELTTLPKLETCVPPSNTRLRRPQVKGARRDLALADIETIHGLSVTTPLRTALDLGSSLRRSAALAALDWYLRMGDFTKADLRRELPRFRGRRGVVQLRELVSLATSLAESPGESWTRMAMHDAGLPAPELQFKIMVDGIERYRLDFAYPKSKVCIEYDGAQFHDDAQAQARDDARRTWLRNHGWIVIVVRKEDMETMRALAWTNSVRNALRTRGDLAFAS